MKSLLFMAMMILGSLLFIVSGANAQYCSTFLPSCHWQDAKELGATTSGEQQAAGEFVPAVAATQEGSEEMTAAGAGRTTGQMDVNENSALTKGREVCGYCSVFERGGFP